MSPIVTYLEAKYYVQQIFETLDWKHLASEKRKRLLELKIINFSLDFQRELNASEYAWLLKVQAEVLSLVSDDPKFCIKSTQYPFEFCVDSTRGCQFGKLRVLTEHVAEWINFLLHEQRFVKICSLEQEDGRITIYFDSYQDVYSELLAAACINSQDSNL
jgi:hypothetical protein